MRSLLHRGRVEDRFCPVDGVVRIFAEEKVSNKSWSRIFSALARKKKSFVNFGGNQTRIAELLGGRFPSVLAGPGNSKCKNRDKG